MKSREEIDIDQVLNNYLATISPEQLIAELESPQCAILMSIPDEDFFHVPIESASHTFKAHDVDQTITLVGDFCSADSSTWENPNQPAHQICSGLLIAENEELALAA